MRVLVLGITTRLGARLAEALLDRRLTPVGLIRRAEQEEPLRAAGIGTVLLDWSGRVPEQLRQALAGAGGAVLAAGTGTGPGSLGPATISISPAGLLSAAVQEAGVPRYVMVSALLPGDDVRTQLGPELPAYLREKKNAERTLWGGKGWRGCVVRPGMLKDSAATGLVSLRAGTDPRPEGGVARADLAATICELLVTPAPVHGVLAISAGTVPVGEAVAALVATPRPPENAVGPNGADRSSPPQ
jgi:nucleoside-diphosphate-sugar epimerase